MKSNQKLVEQIFQNGKLIKKLNPSGSAFNNEAYVYRWLDNEYVVRKIGKQYDLTDNQLVNLEKSVRTYYGILQKHLTIGLPKTFITTVNKEQNIVLLVTEYFRNGKVVETVNISNRIKYFKAIAMTIVDLTNSSSNLYLNKLVCSIDPNPDNFFLNHKYKLIYNDFTPPLYRKNGKWLEFRRLDELHEKRFDKEKRYFRGLNLLLAFVNKIRLYLPFKDYLKFVTWLSNEIQKSQLSSRNSLSKFPQIFYEVSIKKIVDLNEFEKYAVLRDLLRFALSFKQNITSVQVKDIYKKSKGIDGIKILTKKLYG